MGQVRKVVINTCFGGFGLSEDGLKLYQSVSGNDGMDVYDLERDDAVLVQVVETLGEQANGVHARLKVVEVPADVRWEIAEYDGNEWVAEVHRRWS